MTKEGDCFFNGINTLAHSRYSHYLVSNESILKIRSMEEIAHTLIDIKNMLDKADWGFLYPVYCWYKKLLYKYKHNKLLRKYPNFKRLEENL